MNKIKLILTREYLVRVRKKSFLITTIVVPIIMMGFYAAAIYLSTQKSNEINKIAVLDDTDLFKGKINCSDKTLSLTFVKNETEKSFVKKYRDQGFKGFLYINSDTSHQSTYHLHSQSNFNLSTMSTIEDLVNNTLRNRQLLANGINPDEFDKLNDAVKVENTLDTDNGTKKSFAEISYIVSFACGLLIYIMMMSYGTQVMRGVAEEKTNRISEVVISSVRPFQLMMGKILGIGAVGLTQFAIWITLMMSMQMAIPLFFPELMQHANQTAAASGENLSMVAETMQGLSSLPIGKIIFYFVHFIQMFYKNVQTS